MSSVIIIGSIGVGKSTLSKLIADRFCFSLIKEEWESNQYIVDLPSNAFSCQWKQMDISLDQHMLFETLANVVMDRGYWETSVFYKSLYKYLTPEEFSALSIKYHTHLSDIRNNNNIIYLKTSPEVSLQRIINRGREFEKTIDLKYLNSLYYFYEQLVEDLVETNYVYTVDGNKDIEEVYNQVHCLIGNKCGRH